MPRVDLITKKGAAMMNFQRAMASRRGFMGGLALGWVGLYAPGVMAEELLRTPRQTEGPFYPDKLPLDTDNDLIVINDALTPAAGEITWLNGRILDAHVLEMRVAVEHAPLL